MFKDISARVAGLDKEDDTKVGMVAEGDDWLTVYMPDGGPAGGTAGEVRLMPAAQVEKGHRWPVIQHSIEGLENRR